MQRNVIKAMTDQSDDKEKSGASDDNTHYCSNRYSIAEVAVVVIRVASSSGDQGSHHRSVDWSRGSMQGRICDLGGQENALYNKYPQ
jgi:hypothetical protein